jgi:hypothetical protein
MCPMSFGLGLVLRIVSCGSWARIWFTCLLGLRLVFGLEMMSYGL